MRKVPQAHTFDYGVPSWWTYLGRTGGYGYVRGGMLLGSRALRVCPNPRLLSASYL